MNNQNDPKIWKLIENLADEKIAKYQIICADKAYSDQKTFKRGDGYLSLVTDNRELYNYALKRFSIDKNDSVAWNIALRLMYFYDDLRLKLAEREYTEHKDIKKGDEYIKPLLDKNIPEARFLYAKNHPDVVIEQLYLAAMVPNQNIKYKQCYNEKMNELINQIDQRPLQIVLKMIFRELSDRR